MFGGLIDFFILLCLATFVLVAWKFWQQRADEKLRDNPPQRRIIEVSLPVGVSDSAANMSRFYRKAAAAALGDKGARKTGARQLDFVYLVDVPAEGALPRMRCRIYADPDKMDAIKKALKSSFQEAIDVVELQEDDLLPVAMVLRPPDEDDDTPEDFDDDTPEDFDVEADTPEALTQGPSVSEPEISEEGATEDLVPEADPTETDASVIADPLPLTSAASEAPPEQRDKEELHGRSLSEDLDKIAGDVPDKAPIPQRERAPGKTAIDFVLEEEDHAEEPPRFE